jgi:hypothetical protein
VCTLGFRSGSRCFTYFKFPYIYSIPVLLIYLPALDKWSKDFKSPDQFQYQVSNNHETKISNISLMKCLIFSLFVLLSFSAQSQTYSWARQISGTAYNIGNSMTVDRSGNVLMTGQFAGTADFDPGPTTYNLVSAGLNDIFLSKYDATGNLVWAFGFGGASWETGMAVAVDVGGNVFLTGMFSGTVDFDPGPGVYNLTSAGGLDIVIAKYDPAGQLVWAHSYGGSSDDDHGNALTVDATGNLFATGYFKGTVDFDPGPSNSDLTSSYIDVYAIKFDPSGNLVWARNMGGPSYDYGYTIKLDGSGNVLIGGSFRFTNSDYDPGPGVYYLNTFADEDGFVCKLDPSGNFIWARQFTTGAFDFSNIFCLSLDASGNIYTTGSFKGKTDFNPGTGVFNMTSNGYTDGFVCKLTAAGEFAWAKLTGGCANEDYGSSLTTDRFGNTYTIGRFEYVGDFDPGPGVFNMTGYGNVDVFMMKLNSSGNFVWARQLGGGGNDLGTCVTLDAGGNIFTTGSFESTADFDPGAGTAYLAANPGGSDIFISKVSQPGFVLPLQWISFTAEKNSDGVLLKWSTSQEMDTRDFKVLYSTNGNDWKEVATVDASGNSNVAKKYSYVHEQPRTGMNYYRLLETDRSGAISYSETRTVRLDGGSFGFRILNNPVTNGKLEIDISTPTELSLYDAEGRLLWKKRFGVGVETVDASKYQKGMYFLRSDGQSMKLMIR